MRKIIRPLFFCTFIIAISHARDQQPESSAQLQTILSDEWQYRLRTFPDMATHAGDYRYNDKLADVSPAAFAAQTAHAKQMLARLNAIPSNGLSDELKIEKTLLTRDLEEQIEADRFRSWEMPISQFDGFHSGAVFLVSDSPFRNSKDYEDYLARLHGIPKWFDQEMANMRAGMRDHLMQPRYLLEKVAAQAKQIGTYSANDSPFTQPLKDFPASVTAADRARLTKAVTEAVVKDVNPAYLKLAEFVKNDYALAGRAEPGEWSLPDGDARYRFAVREMTTTNLTPEQVHELGLKYVSEAESQMLKIAQREGYHDLTSFNKHIREDKALYAKSGDQLLGLYKQYVDQMQAKLPQLFVTLPKNKLAVVPMEAFRSADAVPADYSPGAGDGSRPGRINVNLYHPSERLLLNVEAIAYHEGIPGHHLQFSITQELTDISPLRKFAYNYTAYTEGWAFYAERLGKDIGFYQDPYSDYGRLENEMWRAVRLVVDTGVHYKHWTRQQMVDYFRAHTAMDEQNIQTEVDRYIAWPGQALGYKIGQARILSLREEARVQLGDRFNIREFHDQVLKRGPLPMDVLDNEVKNWIAQLKAK